MLWPTELIPQYNFPLSFLLSFLPSLSFFIFLSFLPPLRCLGQTRTADPHIISVVL